MHNCIWVHIIEAREDKSKSKWIDPMGHLLFPWLENSLEWFLAHLKLSFYISTWKYIDMIIFQQKDANNQLVG